MNMISYEHEPAKAGVVYANIRRGNPREACSNVVWPILAGNMLVVWLIDDGGAGLVLTLAAVVVGWILTLILAEPYREDPGREIRDCGVVPQQVPEGHE